MNGTSESLEKLRQRDANNYLVLFVLADKQRCHVGRQHVLQQQAVQVLPGLDLILLRAVLVLQQEVLAEARLVLEEGG